MAAVQVVLSFSAHAPPTNGSAKILHRLVARTHRQEGVSHLSETNK